MSFESGESGFNTDESDVDVESLPNIDSPPDNSLQQWVDSLNHDKLYQLRIAPPDNSIENELFEFFGTYSNIILMVREESRREKLHYHVNLELENKRKFIEDLKLKYYWVSGNGGHACTKVREPKNANVYCLKETSHVLAKNIPEDIIKQLRALSYKKLVKSEFAKELASLRMDLLDKTKYPKLQLIDAAAHFLTLKSKYGQIPNWTYAENWAHMIMATRYNGVNVEDGEFKQQSTFKYYRRELEKRFDRFS